MPDGSKVALKLTPREVIFRTKQVKQYRDYLRKLHAPNQVNKVNELYADLASVCPLEEETAEYVGPQLTDIAALSSLPAPLDDDEPSAPLVDAAVAGVDAVHADGAGEG